MTVESATYISDLNPNYPAASDAKSEGDDHIRMFKSTVKTTFPNVTGEVTPTHTELNYVDGVTSAIQTQLDAKQPLDANLTNLAAKTSTGVVVQTSATEYTARTITAGAGVTITNGDGVSGNPTIAVSAGVGLGDVLSDETSSTDGQLVLMSGTGGKTIKKSTADGLVKVASGVASAAVAGTDYAAAGAITTSGLTVPSLRLIGNTTGVDGAPEAIEVVGATLADGALTIASGAASITRVARTSNTILAAADKGKFIDVTSGTFSQTLTAAATLGDGWWIYYRNSGTGVVTLDPDGAEQIEGAGTYVFYPGDECLIQCDGSAFYVPLKYTYPGSSQVVVHTGNGYGSTNTKIRRFTTTLTNTGTAITYADSAGDGGSFTINEAGVYSISYMERYEAANTQFGISVNSNELTSSIAGITAANCLAVTALASTVISAFCSVVAPLSAGAVVRAHAGASVCKDGDQNVIFRICKIGSR